MTPKIVDKETKKNDITRAAIKIFSQKGIDKSKMTDIAKEAGIGKGTIYEYFRSKDEIFNEAFHSIIRQSEEQIAPLLHSDIDPFIKLKNFFDIFLNYYIDENAVFTEILFEFWAEGIRRRNLNLLGKIDLHVFYEKYRKLIQEILEDGMKRNIFKPMNSISVASSIIGVMDGLFLQWIMDRKIFNLKDTVYQFLEVLLKGIRK